MSGFVRKIKVDYVIKNKEGKELARINLGKISQKEINMIDEANYSFNDQIENNVIEFSYVKRNYKKQEYEQLSLFSVGEIKGIK